MGGVLIKSMTWTPLAISGLRSGVAALVIYFFSRNNKTTTYNKKLNKYTKNNVTYNINTNDILDTSTMNIKSVVTNWNNLNLTTNSNNIMQQTRYIIAVKYVKNGTTYKTTLAAANIDDIDSLKSELHTLFNSDSVNTLEVSTDWTLEENNNKKLVSTTLDSNKFNLGQYGSNDVMPFINIDNDTNIDLNDGFNITTQGSNNIFEINDFNLVILDSHTPTNNTNLSVYGNGLNSSNINIVYFSDLGNLSFFVHDETPNIYSEHITNDNINNYNRLNASGTNYNIQTFDRNIKTDLTINNEDYIKGNSFIFDIDNNGILDGDININNINKPGLYNEYHFNKSVTTPFDFTFSTTTNAQYNINNWLFPLNSDNNNNEGRIFNTNDYFAFKLKYDKTTSTISNFENCPKVFDIYGVTSEKDFTIYDINTKKSLLTPSIKSATLISETPANLKLTQGILDIDKSINNIDVLNNYLSTNKNKNTTLDLSHIPSTLNIGDDYALTLGSVIIDNNCYVGPNGANIPKVVEDPINIDNKVILIDGKGMKYKISGTNGEDNSEDFTFDGLNRDKFSLEVYFNLIYTNNTYKHYIYSQCDTNDRGFNIYISDGNIYVRLSQVYDNYLEHIINLTNFVDTDKINYNEWYHLAFTKNITQISVFLNGKRYSVNSLDDYNNISLFSSDLYHPGVIGASNFEGNSITSLNGYISDLKLYNGYVIYESDFIPTKQNCLLKLDVHKYNDSNNYYTNYNKNILVNKKASNTIAKYPYGSFASIGVTELQDFSNNNNNINFDVDNNQISVPIYNDTIEAAVSYKDGYWLSSGTSDSTYKAGENSITDPLNIRTIFMVFEIPNTGNNSSISLFNILRLETSSSPDVHFELVITDGGYIRVFTGLQYQKLNGSLIRTSTGGRPDFDALYGPLSERKSSLSSITNGANVNNKFILAIRANPTGLLAVDGYSYSGRHDRPQDTYDGTVDDFWKAGYGQSWNDPEFRDVWTQDNPTNIMKIFDETPGNRPGESNLYEVIAYDERLSDTEMDNTIKYLNKKWSVYETDTDNITWNIGTNAYSPSASSTLPRTTNMVSHFDGKQAGTIITRPSININGIEDKTIHLIKDIQYNFICDNTDNNNHILSIVDDYSKKFTTNLADRLGIYDLEITSGSELDNWNASSTRKLVWTPTTSGKYCYYSWDGSDVSTKLYGGIIIILTIAIHSFLKLKNS